DKGTWYADLDTSFMKADAKKGFALGNFNNGAVEAKDYVYDGESYYNFGKYMVLKVGDKDVLIDITKGQGMTNETLSDKIVVAIYDEIFMTDADYWRYRDGNKYGYLDLKGKPLKDTYDDATDFVNGYALVIKEGKARIINDKFEEVEEINAATDVESAGDVFTVTADKDVRRYILKTVRENPTGKKDDKKTQASGAEATPTPKADDKKKK
ncbi:MAG: WG repeat-containing protein, partial [Lachnospiraceae bacterium]|nr:WG repeat-containing protein [Lachnospiraceae bacterium]